MFLTASNVQDSMITPSMLVLWASKPRSSPMEYALKERNDVETIRAQHPVVLLELEKLEKLINKLADNQPS